MKLSIIIPVYNEQATIGQVLKKVTKVKLPEKIDKEIIVVNDGSTDKSSAVIKNFLKKNKKIKYQEQVNKGKGAAVIAGLRISSGDYILIQDADLEYDPENYKKLLLPVLQKKAKVVYGTRLKRFPNFLRDEKTFRFFFALSRQQVS